MNIDLDLELERTRYLKELLIDLDDLEEIIIGLSKTTEPTVFLNKIKRVIHSIKGTAGGFGIDLISILCHKLEDRLTYFESQDVDVDNLVTTLFKFKDTLVATIEASLNNNNKELTRIREANGVAVKNPSLQQTNKPPLKKHRALIIETSKLIQKNIVLALSNYDLELSITKDGYEALGRLLKEKFDVIITSMQLPTLDAADLFKIIQEVPNPNKEAKRICITSSKSQLQNSEFKNITMLEKNIFLADELQNIIKNIAPIRAVEVPLNFDRPINIFLVDDSAEIHTLVDIAFKKYPSVKIEHCSNPLDAESSVIRNLPDLILLDVQMPNLSGEEVLRKIKANPKTAKIPITFLTGTDEAQEVQRLSSLGASVIKKPFTVKILAKQVLASFIQM